MINMCIYVGIILSTTWIYYHIPVNPQVPTIPTTIPTATFLCRKPRRCPVAEGPRVAIWVPNWTPRRPDFYADGRGRSPWAWLAPQPPWKTPFGRNPRGLRRSLWFRFFFGGWNLFVIFSVGSCCRYGFMKIQCVVVMFKFWWCLAVLQVWWLVHSCCFYVSAQPPCSWKALLFLGGLPSSSRKNSCGVSDHFLSFELSCSRLGNTTCWLAWGEIEYKVDMMLSSKTHLRERGKHRRAAALQPRYGLRSRYSGLSVPITMGTKYDKTFSGKWSHTSDTIIFRTSVTIEIQSLTVLRVFDLPKYPPKIPTTPSINNINISTNLLLNMSTGGLPMASTAPTWNEWLKSLADGRLLPGKPQLGTKPRISGHLQWLAPGRAAADQPKKRITLYVLCKFLCFYIYIYSWCMYVPDFKEMIVWLYMKLSCIHYNDYNYMSWLLNSLQSLSKYVYIYIYKNVFIYILIWIYNDDRIWIQLIW